MQKPTSINTGDSNKCRLLFLRSAYTDYGTDQFDPTVRQMEPKGGYFQKHHHQFSLPVLIHDLQPGLHHMAAD